MSDLYKDSDYVDVFDAVTGEPHPHKIPKAWLGTEYAEGLEKASKSGGSSSSSSSKPVEIPEGEPSEDWTGDQLKAYAKREDIALGDATKKADIVAVIAAAKATPVS